MVYYIHKQRKNKRGITLRIQDDGQVAVITNHRASDKQIEEAVVKNLEWIKTARKKHIEREKIAQENIEKLDLSVETIIEAKSKAKSFLANRCKQLAIRFELFERLNSMDIKSYKSKWGTCDTRGNITLNWRLMFLPSELRDYVIIHELSHLKEMNHSKRFWNVVGELCENYSTLRKTLNREYVGLMGVE